MTSPPPPEGGGTWIPSGKIYDELRKHGELLVRLTTQIERGRYEERITALEYRVWWMSGAASVAGAVLGRLLPL